MCSSLTQIVFTVVMIAAIALTTASIFGDKWSTVANNVQESIINDGLQGTKVFYKYLPFLCKGADCSAFWQNMEPFEKVIAVSTLMALLFEVVALVWNLVTSCSCCFKKYLIHPLSPLSFMALFFMSSSLGVFYFYSDKVKTDSNVNHIRNGEMEKFTLDLTSSFWLAVGAWCLLVIDTILASVAIFFAE